MSARGFAVATVLLLGVALAAPWLAPQDPYDLANLLLDHARLAPFTRDEAGTLHLLGTDDQGRDVLSAILYGLRVSLGVASGGTALALAAGLTAGLCAAWFGARVDAALMRLVDLQLSFPTILVALMLMAALGQGSDKVVIAIAVSQWAYYARTVRASAAVELQRDYIAAARGLALPPRRILVRHLLPNCLAPVIVLATAQMAAAISLEATLSFLGLGVPVTRPSLGLLIANGAQYVFAGQYWMSLWPGLVLLASIVAIQQAGQWAGRKAAGGRASR
jgi:peptide/nickel transport system permease protein